MAVPFNLEVVVGRPYRQERQIHEEKLATIFQHVVATWRRIVASRDVRDRLQGVFGGSVKEFKRSVVRHKVAQIDVRGLIDGRECCATAFPPGEHHG